jgi:hypothetical protein
MKKVYAYLIKYNEKSDNPSYDLRYFEKPMIPINYNMDKYGYIRAEHLDLNIPESECKHCAGKGKI